MVMSLQLIITTKKRFFALRLIHIQSLLFQLTLSAQFVNTIKSFSRIVFVFYRRVESKSQDWSIETRLTSGFDWFLSGIVSEIISFNIDSTENWFQSSKKTFSMILDDRKLIFGDRKWQFCIRMRQSSPEHWFFNGKLSLN
jgi:hypothetical protein